MTSERNKKRRSQKREKIAAAAPFPFPSRFRLDFHHARSGSTTVRLPRSSHRGIPNPDHRPEASGTEPRYAAFRLSQVIKPEAQEALRSRVDRLRRRSEQLRSNTSSSEGSDNGPWDVRVSADSIDKADAEHDEAVRDILTCYDSTFGGKPRSLLKDLDPAVCKSMSYVHRSVAWQAKVETAEKDIPGIVEDQASGLGDFKEEKVDIATSRLTGGRKASDFRLGGMGTVLAVSADRGTDWQRYAGNQKNHYTIISCLNQSGVLHLPELGYSLPVRPGDVVGFLAYKYDFQFVRDTEEEHGGVDAENEGDQCEKEEGEIDDDEDMPQEEDNKDHYQGQRIGGPISDSPGLVVLTAWTDHDPEDIAERIEEPAVV